MQMFKQLWLLTIAGMVLMSWKQGVIDGYFKR